MKLSILDGDSVVFEIDVLSALTPTNEDERAQVFQILVGALSLLAGIKPPASSSAMVGDEHQHLPTTEQYHSDRTSGRVLHLVTRRDIPAQSSKDQLRLHAQKDCR
ncbi:MAG: hypothetical protein ABS59_12550 [Methylobacterium sp. SCN 67-24]|nr:MAG: hypothetical protein ABS59_12550 [Methylobacterium sp. SCN 67-24]